MPPSARAFLCLARLGRSGVRTKHSGPSSPFAASYYGARESHFNRPSCAHSASAYVQARVGPSFPAIFWLESSCPSVASCLRLLFLPPPIFNSVLWQWARL